MSIICTRCGGTQVVCEATVNPNTKVITEISDDSLQFGRCETCKARSVLTDVEKTKAAIKSGFAGFVEANGRKPHYASCRIVWKYTNDSEDVKIRLLESGDWKRHVLLLQQPPCPRISGGVRKRTVHRNGMLRVQDLNRRGNLR